MGMFKTGGRDTSCVSVGLDGGMEQGRGGDIDEERDDADALEKSCRDGRLGGLNCVVVMDMERLGDDLRTGRAVEGVFPVGEGHGSGGLMIAFLGEGCRGS